MRSIATTFVFGFIVACGGAADEQAPVQAPPPPPPPVAVADTPAPAPTADTPAPAPKPAMADMQAAAIKSMVANGNDAAKVAALYAPDATLFIPGMGGESKGREAVQKSYQDWLDSTTDMKSAVVRTWSKGNQMAVESVVTATDKATGKPWGVDTVALYTFNDDGLITKDHTYFDLLTVLKQTGAYKDERPARPIIALPTAATEMHVAKGDATEDANVANVNALNSAWLKFDEKTPLSLYSDDIVSNNFTLWEPKDKKWIKEAIAMGGKAQKDRSRADWALFGAEDYTVNENEGTATQIGAIDHGKIHIPNKHKTITTHGVTVAQWKDGKVVKSWGWSNVMELDNQLEIGPAAKKAAAKAPAAKKDTTAKPKDTTAKPPSK